MLKKFKNKTVNIKNTILKKELSEEKNKTKKKFIEIIKQFFFTILNLILFNRISKQPVVSFETSLSSKNNLILLLKNFSLPVYLNSKIHDNTANYKLRNSLLNKFKIKNKFYYEILNAAILNIPKDFLENFNNIREEITKININLKPKSIITSYGLYASSLNSIYIAECVSNGTKLILVQHGGRYENLKYFWHSDYELEVSDNFISWGKKKKNKKIKNFGITKHILINNINKNSKFKNNKKILFLMMSKGRYLRGVDSEISVKNLFRYYKTICPQFYTELRKILNHN